MSKKGAPACSEPRYPASIFSWPKVDLTSGFVRWVQSWNCQDQRDDDPVRAKALFGSLASDGHLQLPLRIWDPYILVRRV